MYFNYLETNVEVKSIFFGVVGDEERTDHYWRQTHQNKATNFENAVRVGWGEMFSESLLWNQLAKAFNGSIYMKYVTV